MAASINSSAAWNCCVRLPIHCTHRPKALSQMLESKHQNKEQTPNENNWTFSKFVYSEGCISQDAVVTVRNCCRQSCPRVFECALNRILCATLRCCGDNPPKKSTSRIVYKSDSSASLSQTRCYVVRVAAACTLPRISITADALCALRAAHRTQPAKAPNPKQKHWVSPPFF